MKTKGQILAQIKQAKARIAKERDKLRDLISDLDQIADDCDEAHYDLERAADALSRLL
jgi:ABC-type transporter Mla subunit MlaD